MREGLGRGKGSARPFTRAPLVSGEIASSQTGRNPGGTGCRGDIGRETPPISIEGHSFAEETITRASARPPAPNSTHTGDSISALADTAESRSNAAMKSIT